MPRAKTAAGWLTLGVHEDLEEAMYLALEGMVGLIQELLGVARLSCQIECAEGMAVTVLQTVSSTGLEAGKAPAEEIQPEPVWSTRPGASTEG